MRRFHPIDIVLVVYAVIGLSGSLLIIDEFDAIRMTAITFVGLPGMIGWFFLQLSFPEVLVRYRHPIGALMVAVVAIFGWGHVLLLNAVGDGQRDVEVAQQIGSITGTVAHKQGPLGIIYRSRF